MGLVLGLLLRLKKVKINRFVNSFITLTVLVLVLLIGIVAGYTITERLFEIGLQTLYELAVELVLLTALPIAIGFVIALITTRIGRCR